MMMMIVVVVVHNRIVFLSYFHFQLFVKGFDFVLFYLLNTNQLT